MADSPLDDTIGALEAVVADCAARDDRVGYFAAMYVAVTRTVATRTADHGFADGPRMERFVAAFARRYLAAHAAWRSGRPCAESWRRAFEAAGRWRPVVLQHLLLGMNAHINLDLGVTASELGDGASIDAVRADFDAVNDVLAELVDGCQAALGQVSPWLGLADRIGGSGDETVIRFSLVAARRQAWSVAERLAPLTGAERDRAIAAVDAGAAQVARAVEHPGVAASAALLLVRLRERARPRDVMRLLAAVRPRDTLKSCPAQPALPARMVPVTKRSTEQLHAGLDHVAQAPVGRGRLEMIVRRPALDEREVLDAAELDLDIGLVGDTWGQRPSTRTEDGSPHPHMQVTLMNAPCRRPDRRVTRQLAARRRPAVRRPPPRNGGAAHPARSCGSAPPSSRSPTSPIAAAPSSPAGSASTRCAS